VAISLGIIVILASIGILVNLNLEDIDSFAEEYFNMQGTDEPVVQETLSSTQTPTTRPKNSSNYDREFNWKHNDWNFTYSISISKQGYHYYKGLERDTDLAKYANDSYNRKLAAKIAKTIKEKGDELGFTYNDMVMMVIEFVQYLPYMDDNESTGVDEYYKYPIETLVDGSGDCEDSSILVTAILREMGHDVVLLKLPGHVAVGVKGDENTKGTYWIHNGTKYFYLETTGDGWGIGEVPPEHKAKNAKVVPVC